MAQVILRDKGKVLGRNGQQGLIVFKNESGKQTESFCRGDFRAGSFGVEEGAYAEGDVFVLERFDGFGMDDGGSVVRQFDGVRVGQAREELGIRETFRIGVQYTRNIFPDGYFFRVERMSKYGGGIV